MGMVVEGYWEHHITSPAHTDGKSGVEDGYVLGRHGTAGS